MAQDDPGKQAFFTAINAVGAFHKKCMAIHKRFGEIDDAAKPAFAERDAAALASSAKGLTELLEEIQDTLPGGDAARALIGEARKVPEMNQKHADSFDKWESQLGFLEGLVKRDVTQAAALLKAIKAKCAKLRGALDDAKSDLAGIEAKLDAEAPRVVRARAELKQLYDAGWIAFGKRDTPVLEALKKKAAQVPTRELAETLKGIAQASADFKSAHGGKSVSPHAEKKLLDGLKLLQGRREQLETALFECDSLKARLRGLDTTPIDLDRAAAHLELDRSAKADLHKALQGDESQMTRGLDVLAKKLKARLGGKEMFARLRKAQLV